MQRVSARGRHKYRINVDHSRICSFQKLVEAPPFLLCFRVVFLVRQRRQRRDDRRDTSHLERLIELHKIVFHIDILMAVQQIDRSNVDDHVGVDLRYQGAYTIRRITNRLAGDAEAASVDATWHNDETSVRVISEQQHNSNWLT